MDKVLYGIAALAAAAGIVLIVIGLSSLGQPPFRQTGLEFLNFVFGISALISAVLFAAIGQIIALLEKIASGVNSPVAETNGRVGNHGAVKVVPVDQDELDARVAAMRSKSGS